MYKQHSLVMIPTDKAESALIKSISSNEIYHSKNYLTQEYLNHIDCKAYHLYVLSDDEIKNGEWGYDDIMKKVFKHNSNLSLKPGNQFKKIIATTDKSLKINLLKGIEHAPENWRELPQIPKSFIEHFISEYNNGNVITEVEVEFYHTHETGYDKELCIKINSDNTINIKDIVEKTYIKTKKELAKLLSAYAIYTKNDSDFDIDELLDVDKWIDKYV